MSEIRRSIMCPSCGLRFLVIFDSGHTLGETPVQLSCPRIAGPVRCEGYVTTHVPERWRAVPAPVPPTE